MSYFFLKSGQRLILMLNVSTMCQGGDTRREEVLSKVLVDISIHTTSHASDTAQNKLCSFWMGPVLLWTVIHEKKDDLTVLDRSSLLQKGNLAMSKTLQRLLEA